MDWSWLTGIFQTIWTIIKKIVHLKWSDLWKAIQDLVHRLKNWYRWYQQNVQKQIQAARQRFRLLFDHFILPVIRVIDTIRRITQIVGLFNKRLAAKLNLVFLRIEAKLLLPLNLYNQRLNVLSGMFSGFLTQLGYLDRATLDNSIWRDVRQLREIFRNPLAGTMPDATLPTTPTYQDQKSVLIDYLQSGGGDLAPRVADSVTTFRGLINL